MHIETINPKPCREGTGVVPKCGLSLGQEPLCRSRATKAWAREFGLGSGSFGV